jgi:hypothetical protein
MTARDVTSLDLFLVHHFMASPFFLQALATRGGLLAYLIHTLFFYATNFIIFCHPDSQPGIASLCAYRTLEVR